MGAEQPASAQSISARRDSWKISFFKVLTRHRAAVALIIMLAALLASGAVTLKARSLIYLGAGASIVGFWSAAGNPKPGRSVAKSRGFFDRDFFDLNAIWAYPLSIALYASLYAVAMLLLRLVLVGVSDLSVKLGPLSYDFFITALAAPAIRELLSLRRWFKARSWAGALLLNLSDCPKVHSGHMIRLMIFLPIVLVFTVIAFMGADNDVERRGLLALATAFTWASASELRSSLTRGKLEFRQMAVVYNDHLIPWAEIESWRWDSETLLESYDGSVILEICTRGIFRTSRLRIHVSPADYDNVTGVMNQYFSEWPSNQLAG